MTKHPAGHDPLTSEFGWPLPRRKQHFEDLKEGVTHHRQISFMDAEIRLPVFRVPLNLPKYRMLNGRTASAQQEWLARNPDKPDDFFEQDPESEEVQRIQHELLSKVVGGAGLLKYFTQPENKQKEPLYLDCNGFVVNGNRRLCTWRRLVKEDTARYRHFEHIDVIVLPPADEKAIDKLEGELQVEPDIREDYTWDSLANMMKQRQAKHGLDTKQIADFYRKKESEVNELLDMLEYAAVYLEKRGKARQWSEVSDKQFAFQQMVKKRESLANAGSKRLFEEMAFILIDDPEGGRLYEAIPDAHKHFEAIKRALLEAFPVAAPRASHELDLLGGGAVDSADLPLAEEIGRDEESRRKAHGTIRDQIELAKFVAKERKSADFLLTQLRKANELVQNAIAGGLRPESDRTGVEPQIRAIELGLGRIRKWLTENA
ncbi:MAG TPA: hypothetical protein VJ783_32285 [Pirellulales bacterium]|nr:hypothetical protein [Pirellulales bacterium]